MDSQSAAAAPRTQRNEEDADEERMPQSSMISISKSVSNGCHNCSKEVWLRSVEEEASKIWELGKEFGATATGDDGIILSKLAGMERRDAQEAGDLADMEPRRGDVGE